ncbi:MAG TPA: MFS transporter [Terriglobales bacterium]
MTFTVGANRTSAPGSAAPRRVSVSRAWAVWAIASLFYLVAYFIRVSPAVMTQELMQAFHMGAARLGTLSAAYFYAYVALQIPVGILVDTWGSRKLLVWGAIATAGGSAVFGVSTHFAEAFLARAVIGGATAVAWIVCLKLITHWFPGRRFAMMSGLTLMLGNLGALVAQVPLRLLVARFAWRPVTVVSGGIILVFAVLAFVWVRNDPADIGQTGYATPPAAATSGRVADFLGMFRYRNTWLILFAQGGLLGPVLAFAGLWGPDYLGARFHLSAASAAGVDSVMLLAFAIASPLMGYMSDRIGARKPIYLGSAGVAAACWAAMFLSGSGLGLETFVGLAAIASFAASSCILGFAFGKESVPARHLGAVSGLMNMGNMFGVMLLQPAIGWMLDRMWSGQWLHGARSYSAGAFQAAFSLAVAWAVLSVALLAFTRDTHCHQMP